jgi:tetratricopeptide (TPR) repeat protein
LPKKKAKNKKLERIVKLIADEKSDEVLELADNNDVEELLGIGVLLQQNKVHDVAEKIFDRVIQLNPNLGEAWYNKGVSLGNLGKWDESIECFDEAIKINRNYEDAWYNKGVSLGNLGKYNEEIKCYDEAIKINPNYNKAWLNKGAALGNLKKYDEEIKCYDEAIKINPNLKEAWYNKGVSLGNLGKWDESIKCFNEVINIDPNFAEANGNVGISYLNLHEYKKALTALRNAKELFSKKGAEKDANKAQKFELLAKNALELMDRLRPLDQKFLSSLDSQSLPELEERSLKISKDVQDIVKDFKKKEIPKEAIKLLISKAVCFTSLSKVLQLERIDLKELRQSIEVFEEWGLTKLAISVESLIVFIRGISKYTTIKDIKKIPEDIENYLLQLLKASYVLDGILTQEITGRIKGELYAAKPVGREKAPEIKYIPLPDIKKDCLRICLVQLDILLTEKFPYKLIEKGKIEEKILKALEVANQQDVDIICFPELSFAKEFVSKVKKYKDMIIIAGSFYDQNFNKCPVIVNGEEYPVYKINPSPYLETEIARGKGMKSGKDIKIFGTKDRKFTFGVLICLDYLAESYRLYNYESNNVEGVNFIFNPSFNPDPERFQRRADTDCENYHVDIVQTNVSKYGGTCIVGVEHKDVIKRLIDEGYRQNDGTKYKLCESFDEMMIIADLKLTGVEVPTHVKGKPRINIKGRYRFKNGHW